ncbi:MAG: tetratricopeptide repeat protein [Anaerolineaceae bacterium]|nr:tetratricopeptide repeat protein [Anaerolineaceae bacterium]
MDRGLLRQLLRTAFSEAELRDLCFDIRLDYEELPGRSKLEKIPELIAYCERVGNFPDFIARCQAMRPRLDWQLATDVPAASSEHGKLEQAIAALEAQRVTLGDVIVEAALTPLRQQLEVLKSPKLPPQRKQVTVLYAQQSGFTMMYQGADLETLRDLVAQAWQRLDAAVTQQGGLVNSRSGEKLTALFGANTAHPDDISRAIKAALDMQTSLKEMKKAQDIPLSIRIGISTGPVLLEQESTGGEFTIIGDTVKIASGLEEKAPPNGILISDSTYDQVRGIFDVAPSEPLSLRGRAGPVLCYQVRGMKAIAFNVERHSVAGVTTRMIGRDFELAQLQEAYLAAAEDSERQMVTITGESGLGKSRLLDEGYDWLELRPERIRFFKAEAHAETESTPYGLLNGLLSQRIAGLENSTAKQRHQALTSHLSDTFLPDPEAEMKTHFIGQLLGFNFTDSPHLQPVAEDPKQLQDRATLYLIDYFNRHALLNPVVIFLENLQWADDSSLDLFNRLALGLAGKPVLIAAAAELSFWEHRPHWGEGYEWHTRLTLRPLSRRDSRRLLEDILQKMDNPPEALSQQILDRAAGNPLYLVEIVQMLLREGTIIAEGEKWTLKDAGLDRLRVPESLVGILQANLDALSLPERSALRQAAVMGSTFWNRAVARLAGDAAGEKLQSTDQVLAQLHGREIISRRESSRFAIADEYAFRNKMLHQVARDSVPRRGQMVYHALAAQWLLEQCEDQADEFSGEIADHLARSGQTEKAVEWLQRAGDYASTRYAHAEAIAYYGRALTLTPDEAIDARIDLLLKREAGYHLRGERASQAEDITQLEAVTTDLANVTLQARVALRRAEYATAISDYPAAVQAAQNGLTLAQQTGETDLIVRTYLALAKAFMWQGEYSQARHYLLQALAQSNTAHQLKLQADSLGNLGNIASYEGDDNEAHTYFEQAQAIYRKLGNKLGEAKVLNNLGVVASRQGDDARARTYYEPSIRLHREVGDLLGESTAIFNFGKVLANEGDYAGARTYYEQSMTIARQIGYRRGEGLLFNNLGLLESQVGNTAGARAYFEESLAVAREIGDRVREGQSLGNLGMVAQFEEDFAAAREYCQRALIIQREIGDKDGQCFSLTFLGDALVDLGELQAAVEAFTDALNLRRQLGQQAEAIETEASLALVWLIQKKLAPALDSVDEILAWLETHSLDKIGQSSQVKLICYKVLMACAGEDATINACATELLSEAYKALMAQADRFSEPSERQLFLENIPHNREIIAAWEAQD